MSYIIQDYFSSLLLRCTDSLYICLCFFFPLCFFFCHARFSLSHSPSCAQSRACCTATTAAAEKPNRRSFEEVSSSDAKTNTTGDLHELWGDSDGRAHDLLFFFLFFFLWFKCKVHSWYPYFT